MTASEQAIDDFAAWYASILDDPQRAAEIRATRERYLAEQVAGAVDRARKEDDH